jgi:N-acetylmuramoyl-L-alanine amidase
MTRTSCFLLFALLVMLFPAEMFAQLQPGENLQFAFPNKDSVKVNASSVYIRGLARPGRLVINGNEVNILNTGGFYTQVQLKEGWNAIPVQHHSGGNATSKQLHILYEIPASPKPVEGFAIEYIKIHPEEELWLREGDAIRVEVKASPGMKAYFFNLPMIEDPKANVKGIYRAEYIVSQYDKDSIFPQVRLEDPGTGAIISKGLDKPIRILSTHSTLTGITKGNTAVYFGLGEDRLGGAKMGFVDSLVRMEVTGKMQGMYRVRLAENADAYVSDRSLTIDTVNSFRPYSLTGSWSVMHNGKYDVVSIGLSERLPYSSVQKLNPTTLVVDIYGAVNNTNWITRRQGLKAIKNVWHEQVAKDIFRVYIELQKPQLWGYDIGYSGNALTIKVRPQPQDLKLKKMVIGVDAGHGGSALGARGLTGVYEKDITLAISHKLKEELEKEGIKVVMTRTEDKDTPNGSRTQLMKEVMPDFLVSIHCNSASRPTARGTSTYYRHIAYRNLTQAILKEVLKLGLEDFGNIGSFNFFFSAPTEYQTVLVETAFISSPEDEAKLVDENFQREMAKSIVKGLKNFLKEVKKENKITQRNSIR